MVYYILVYVIKQYALKYIPHLIAMIGIISLVVYILWFPYKYETGEKGMYGVTTLFRWIPYSAFMLFGSWMGLKHEHLKYRPFGDFCKMIVCLVAFYVIQFAAKKNTDVAPFQIVTLLPLLGIVFYFNKWCRAEFWKGVYTKKLGKVVIMTISSLCLESYLIQNSVFTTKMNGIFPLNLPIMVMIVLFVSYVCKCFSRFFIQTFEDREYRWKDMVKLY